MPFWRALLPWVGGLAIIVLMVALLSRLTHGGMPAVQPKEVKTSRDPKRMLEFDLENERETLVQYRERVRQADAMGEFALSEVLRSIMVQEQEHLQDLADALGIEAPEI